jgi:hypothetical protein
VTADSHYSMMGTGPRFFREVRMRALQVPRQPEWPECWLAQPARTERLEPRASSAEWCRAVVSAPCDFGRHAPFGFDSAFNQYALESERSESSMACTISAENCRLH